MAKLPRAKFMSNILKRKPKSPITREQADVRRLQRARKIDEGRASRAGVTERAKKIGRSLKGYGIATGAGVAGATGEAIGHRLTEGKKNKGKKNGQSINS